MARKKLNRFTIQWKKPRHWNVINYQINSCITSPILLSVHYIKTFCKFGDVTVISQCIVVTHTQPIFRECINFGLKHAQKFETREAAVENWRKGKDVRHIKLRK